MQERKERRGVVRMAFRPRGVAVSMPDSIPVASVVLSETIVRMIVEEMVGEKVGKTVGKYLIKILRKHHTKNLKIFNKTSSLSIQLLASGDPRRWIERNRETIAEWFKKLITQDDPMSVVRLMMGEKNGKVVEEVIRLLEVVLAEGLANFTITEGFDPDYLSDLFAYTGGAVLIARILSTVEEGDEALIEKLHDTLEWCLDEAVMMWGEVEMLKEVKEEDEEEIGV